MIEVSVIEESIPVTVVVSQTALTVADDGVAVSETTTTPLVSATVEPAYSIVLGRLAGFETSLDAINTSLGGLVVGTDIQAYDAGLQSISGLTTAADRMIYTTGPDAYATATLTGAGRTLMAGADAAAQRAALGLGITGAVLSFAMIAAPTGWLECDGAAVSRTTYAALFTAIGTTYGAGDGSTTFNLPDMRGEFPRGWDNGRGVDTGRGIGTAQAQDIQSHDHDLQNQGFNSTDTNGGARFLGADGGNLSGSPTTRQVDAAGGDETRPRNIALMFCIKT